MNDVKTGGETGFGIVNGKWFGDSRICLSVLYFDNPDDADAVALKVKEQGRSYNGGWFDGMPCGREPARDYKDSQGIQWYAVSC
jgi:hypothetical protein